MREGTANGPLSTTPRHICQIRGISAAREARIGGERRGDSQSSHMRGSKGECMFEIVVISVYVAGF